MLTNEVYAGVLVWGIRARGSKPAAPVRVENAWPQLVDRDTFDRVQSLMQQRAPAR